MIEKLDTKMEYVEISILGNKKAECLDFEAGRKLNLKINELVDAVNKLQKEREAERFEIQEWIGILEAVRKSVNVHEKQIDELQMKMEPKKCETPAENVPEPIKLYVCADGFVYDNLDVAKSHAASIFNPLPAGATTTDRAYLEQELIRTRKALDVAVDALKEIDKTRCGVDVKLYAVNHKSLNAGNVFCWTTIDDLHNALDQIIALEQKDK